MDMNIINIKCPHCGHNFKLAAPINSVLVGPCSQCQEILLMVLGNCLTVNKQILISTDGEGLENYLSGILSEFDIPGIVQKVAKLIEAGRGLMLQDTPANKGPITKAEVEEFLIRDIHQVDNPKLFAKIFGPPSPET